MPQELKDLGYSADQVDTYLGLFAQVEEDITGVRYLKEKLAECLPEETAERTGAHHVLRGGGQRSVSSGLKFDPYAGAGACPIIRGRSSR